MAFEFFFGLLGLISSDSKSRHKSRLEGEWRLPTPLNTNLFGGDSSLKSPLDSSTSSNFGKAGGQSGNAANLQKRPIFSTTGTLATASNNSASEGLFSSASNSSASSIASSASNLTTNSSSAFIKPGEHPKKYEFRLNLIGEKEKLADESPLRLKPDGGGLGATTSSTADLLAEAQQDSGLASDEQEGAGGQASGGSAPNGSRTQQLRKLYCLVVCACLWLHVGRLVVGLLVDKSLVTLDLYSLGAYKIHFLIPAMCLAIQAAAVSTLFIRNNDETSWLVPFYSSKDYLIRSRSNFKPRIEDYTKRVNVSIVLAVFLALVSSISLSAYLVHCVGQSDILITQQQQQQQQAAEAAAAAAAAAASNQAQSTSAYGGATGLTTMSTILSLQRNQLNASSSEMASGSGGSTSLQGESAFSANKLERAALAALLAFDVLWAVYSTYICFLVSFYFNLICSIMKSRFHGISKIIEDLAESNTTKTTNQARKITTLYLEHNEACELLDESNDFWQYLIFFTYFTYIPAYCYCLYNLFFVDFEAWPSFITWVIHTHTGFIILLISFSAAGVSTEAHAPYTSLHTLSLIQLPLDVEVNIATFLHRVRGLTIGYSCYDLFAITNASMSNTAAACASYFLIVADFSRSSVFTLAQMNGSASTGAASTTPTPSG